MTLDLQTLIENLGQPSGASVIKGAIREFGLTDVQDDPPARRYIGSKAVGLSLLFHDDHLLDVQVFVKPTKTYQAFSGALPYGLDAEFTRLEVHKLLGSPIKSDAGFSKYLMNVGRVKLIIEYNREGRVRYISASSIGRA